MFKSVGEGMEYEASGFGSDEDMSSADNVSFQSPSDTSGLQENTESPPPVRKMFWHSLQIEKVQELVPEEIRWFYKEDSKARWVAFIGYDSLRIECRFRALEYARQRSNSVEEEDIDANIHVRGGLYEVDITNSKIHPVYWKGKSLPILRGTWFVDGTGQPLEYEYSLQLEQDHLTKFRGMSIPDSQTDGKKAGKTEALHTVKFTEFHVDWYDVNEVYMYSEAASSRMFRYVTNKLSIHKPGTGTRLYRGYYEQATMDDKPPDVTQLVFVVHGIGQKYNQNKIISCCNDLRNGTHKLIPKYFPDLTSSRQRIEFLPVEWRTDLQLDGDLVESITPEKLRHLRVLLNSTAMDILYYTSPLYRGEIIDGLSSELNRLYQIFVEKNPYFEVNNGQVSICVHSLGSVILYDILTGWDPIELYDQYVFNVLKKRSETDPQKTQNVFESMTTSDRSKRLHDFYINSIIHKETSPLMFKVGNLFSLGSPLGVFLSLRGIRPKPNGLMDHLLPKSLCKRFYNIYHPSDPIAYRIEPLVLKHYSTIAPLKIHKLKEAKKVPYSEMKAKAFAAFGKAASQVKKMGKADSVDGQANQNGDKKPITAQTEGSQSTIANASQQEATSSVGDNGGFKGALKGLFSKLGGRGGSKEEKMAAELTDYQSVASDEDVTDDITSDDGDVVEQTDLEFRLDYVLPSSDGMTSSYVNAIFSHTSYWASPEIALFLLSQIFPDYGPTK